MDKCAEMPSLDPVGDGDLGHLSACWLPHNEADREAVRRRVAHVELAKSAGPAGA
jgi:hypothetical protein